MHVPLLLFPLLIHICFPTYLLLSCVSASLSEYFIPCCIQWYLSYNPQNIHEIKPRFWLLLSDSQENDAYMWSSTILSFWYQPHCVLSSLHCVRTLLSYCWCKQIITYYHCFTLKAFNKWNTQAFLCSSHTKCNVFFTVASAGHNTDKTICHFQPLLSVDHFSLLQGSNRARKGSHTELLEEELQATGCTLPTLQQGNQLNYVLLLCGKLFVLCAAWNQTVAAIIIDWLLYWNSLSLSGCTVNRRITCSFIAFLTKKLLKDVYCSVKPHMLASPVAPNQPGLNS